MTTKTNTQTACLVVYGLGKDDRPHAARFDVADQPAVQKAAALMGFKLGRADGDVLLDLAKQLPQGKIFATGRSLVPYIKRELFDQLVGQLQNNTPTPPASAPTANKAPSDGDSAGQLANADPAKIRIALRTSLLTNLSARDCAEMAQSLPSADRKMLEFCGLASTLWATVWQPVVASTFADRSRAFAYLDFQRTDLEYFAPTVYRCWDLKWLWGVFVIDKRWHLWTGVRFANNNRSATLYFDITDLSDERHPSLQADSLGHGWRPKSTRQFMAFKSQPFPIPANLDPKSAEVAKICDIASAVVGAAEKLLAATAPAAKSRTK